MNGVTRKAQMGSVFVHTMTISTIPQVAFLLLAKIYLPVAQFGIVLEQAEMLVICQDYLEAMAVFGVNALEPQAQAKER